MKKSKGKNRNEFRIKRLLRKVFFTQDNNKMRGPSHGCGHYSSEGYPRRNQDCANEVIIRNSSRGYRDSLSRTKPSYLSNNPNRGRPFEQRLKQFSDTNNGSRPRNGFFNNRSGNGRNKGNFSVPHPKEVFHKTIHTVNHELTNATTQFSKYLRVDL